MANVAYVNVNPSESRWGVIPQDKPRHVSVGAALNSQVPEGWPTTGRAVIVEVDEDGQNLGVM